MRERVKVRECSPRFVHSLASLIPVISGEEHIVEYHEKGQMEQLVEYVCKGNGKERKNKKKLLLFEWNLPMCERSIGVVCCD